MDAGKKFDEFVAIQLLKWEKRDGSWFAPGSDVPAKLEAFSTDVGCAWRFVDQTLEKGFKLQLSGSRIWQARYYKSVAMTLQTRAFEATGSNPAEAICLVTLALEGITVPRT